MRGCQVVLQCVLNGVLPGGCVGEIESIGMGVGRPS